MVVRQNKYDAGIGGHISTYASLPLCSKWGSTISFAPATAINRRPHLLQGHASPGVYARAFLEGGSRRITSRTSARIARQAGLSSYPHPWLMPDFWRFLPCPWPRPINAIYQARFMRYLENAA